MSVKIVFIGAGRMASAMVRGLLEKKIHRPEAIACTCGGGATGARLAEATGIRYLPDITPVLHETEAVILACKPQQLTEIPQATTAATAGKLVLSILAGTPLQRLNETFDQAGNLVRAMPNLPGQIGAGTTAFAALRQLTERDRTFVENSLGALGRFHQVEEACLDAVTALSGSGPAYVFEFAAALREAGIRCGLDETLAYSLTVETLLGSAMLLNESDEKPETLRDTVTSPGGTTAAALRAFDDSGFRNIVERALSAAKDRSLELAGE